MQSPGLIAALTLVAAVAAFMLYQVLNPNSAFAAAGEEGGATGGESTDSSSASPPSGVAMQWNDLIAQAASAAKIDPVLLKAICAQETGFRPNAINPEKDFTLNGVSYAQYDSKGQALDRKSVV